MGRSVANEGFIRALLRNDPFEAYHFYLSDNNQLAILQNRLGKEFGEMLQEGRFVLGTFADLPRALQEYEFHCFHLSDCLLHNSQLAVLRNRYARRLFPITGCTHTLSYARYMPLFQQQVWNGTSARDAVIATSRAAVDMVTTVFDRLRKECRFEDGAGVAPRVERIPLGVDLSMLPVQDTGTRAAVRSGLGAGEDAVVLLVFARISHYSKMDLLPLLRAVQRLGRMGVPMNSLHLVVAGFMQQGDRTPNVLGGFAKALGFKLHVQANPSDESRNGLYAAADIFVSPVDNMQETFGLTILEAGAMGLPVVASDYDGYRDLVIDGKTGLLVPTLGPSDSSDIDAMAHLAFDTSTHLSMAQRTVVDVPALAQALHALISSPERRKAMGETARKHVRGNYGWDAQIDRHLALWETLNQVPVQEDVLRGARHPLRTDYAEIFGGYPSKRLADDMQVVWSRAGEAVYRGVEQPVIYEGVASIVDADMLRIMLFSARKPVTVTALTALLVKRMQEEGQASGDGSAWAPVSSCHAQAMLLWALKHDFLERV
ncbi:glycosyltransferase family 4 protein [Desulfovibrio mangrovi]|uniref:glycosyltransferase family 4 protein n=1 Tax=Desulfovibrio mangrovi TaxID=2976983 RepID=UPI002246B030|nr:glycosyltransferase family 4 protein [Desulfovibrio mangrovi]UZP68414.1 glycosyltransferase family 4 protein [Desulfovibrio mangrovi]